MGSEHLYDIDPLCVGGSDGNASATLPLLCPVCRLVPCFLCSSASFMGHLDSSCSNAVVRSQI